MTEVSRGGRRTQTTVEDVTIIAVSDTSLSVLPSHWPASPDRAVGLNLVDPPDGAIVEVVIAEQTTAATRDRVTDFVESLDASPVVVRDTPGFAALRLELAAIAEAIRMVEDGVAGIRDIDRTFERGESDRDGPLVRADRHGLETVLTAIEDLSKRLDERFAPPALLRQKVATGTRRSHRRGILRLGRRRHRRPVPSRTQTCQREIASPISDEHAGGPPGRTG